MSVGLDILLLLSPPITLIDYLERLWQTKQAKGESIPDEYMRWLERWRKIRSDGASDVDYVTPDEWNEIKDLVF